MVRQISDDVTVITKFHLAPKRRDADRHAHLVVLSGANVGRVYELNQQQCTIGREDQVEIQIMDAGISRRHAVIERLPDRTYLLSDAGSRNGTYANNLRLTESHPLRDGDKIQLGTMTVLKFAHADAAEAIYAQQMYEAAHRDGLTQAFNRRYFKERLAAEGPLALRTGRPLSLLMLDLDHFKQVNDTHGHLVGDAVLKELAAQVGRVTRDEDVLVRYGGEEFAVICRHTDLLKASGLAERIRHHVANVTFTADEVRLRLTVSIGVATLPQPGVATVDELVQAADAALYEAKDRGRNLVVTRRP